MTGFYLLINLTKMERDTFIPFLWSFAVLRMIYEKNMQMVILQWRQ